MNSYMEFFKKKFKVRNKYLELFLQEYWFAPQDVLLRSIEANLLRVCRFKHPILDIGIGDGGISRLLFPSGLKIDVGIDLEETGFKKAEAIGVYQKVMCADAQKMPFKNASFNTVVSNSTFEHIKDDLKAISEVSRVLKKNGYFLITVPSEFLQETILSIEGIKNQKRAKDALNKFNKRLNHFHYRSLPQWESILQKNNLRLVYHKYYFPKYVTHVWYWLLKRSLSKFRGRELWSYLAHSHLRIFIPKKLVIYLLGKYVLKKAYYAGIPTRSDSGSMLFLVARKSS